MIRPAGDEKPQSLVGATDWQPLEDLPEDHAARERAHSVVMLKAVEGDHELQCSGALIDARYVLTNYHCVGQRTSGITVHVDYFEGILDVGNGIPGKWSRFGGDDLDYSVVELERSVDPPYLAPTRFPLDSSLEGDEEPAPIHGMQLIQHPGDQPTWVSEVDCTIPSADGWDEKFFRHRCDAANGSSGSPVLDASGQMIGLHRQGHSESADEGLNQATRVDVIWDDLRRRARRKLDCCSISDWDAD
jgi:hypothetical protein